MWIPPLGTFNPVPLGKQPVYCRTRSRLTTNIQFIIIKMVQDFQNRDVVASCHNQMKAYKKNGDDMTCIAFPPGGGERWLIITKSGSWVANQAPPASFDALVELQKEARITWIAYTPQGGWVALNAVGSYRRSSIPVACENAIKNKSAGGVPTLVAFSQNNGWVVVYENGARASDGLPQGCRTDIDNLSSGANRVTCIAFPPQGGDRWVVINSGGGYIARSPGDELYMYMNFFAQVNGPIRYVSYDGDNSGWSVLADMTRNDSVNDGFSSKSVYIRDMYREVHSRLDGNVVGYSCTIGSSSSLGAFSWGSSRTTANPPAQIYLPGTKSHVASVSKFVTALAAIRYLGNKTPAVSLGDKIGGHLPNFWKLDPKVYNITIRQLLSHQSGIKQYGPDSETYDGIKDFFESLNDQSDPKDWIPDGQYNYSNWNFGIFRILLPVVDGFNAFSGDFQWPMADRYIQIVQQNVFAPVGVSNVVPMPPTTGYQSDKYALAYKWPGASSGLDHGNFRDRVGAYGWWLSIENIIPVLRSLNNNDGKILSSTQLSDMRSLPVPGSAPTKLALGLDAQVTMGPSAGARRMDTGVLMV